MAAEDRLKQLRTLRDDSTPLDAKAIADLENSLLEHMAKLKELSNVLGQNHPDMRDLRQQIDARKDRLRASLMHSALDKELEQARRDFVEAEVEFRLVERRAELARSRTQKRLEVLDEKWRSLARPRGDSRETSSDLERKLDDLVREVRELRREMKK